MIDFETRLTALLDDVATSIHPLPDPDSLFVPDSAFVRTVTAAPNTMRGHGRRFRPSIAAVAAAGVVLLGGSAFAMERLIDDAPRVLTTATSPATEPQHERDHEPTTTVAEHPTTISSTPDGAREHPVVVEPEPTVVSTEPTAPTTSPTSEPPAVIEFTAKLGANGLAKNPMQQGFYGTAQPGSVIHLGSAFGTATTTAGDNGAWEVTLKMFEVPAGTRVAVRITSSTSDRVREFSLLRPTPPPPATIEFTANLGANGQGNTPMTQGFYGTAQPGSAIRVGTEWGVAETVAGPNGKWETTLVLHDVAPGTTVPVRVTSSTSDRVREFTLHRPGEPAPVVVAFTAHAAQDTTDHTPPVNEYWGTATPGAVITIASEYGGTQVTANGDGNWTARVEFPDAPLGSAFNVHLVSSKNDGAFNFSLTRVSPG